MQDFKDKVAVVAGGANGVGRCIADILAGEGAKVVDRAYLLYLNLYLLHFRKLSAKEQRALTLVEVEAVSYKDAAQDLGIRLENLKMVIFRGRRKIFRGMGRSLEELRVKGEQRDAEQPSARAGRRGVASRSVASRSVASRSAANASAAPSRN